MYKQDMHQPLSWNPRQRPLNHFCSTFCFFFFFERTILSVKKSRPRSCSFRQQARGPAAALAGAANRLSFMFQFFFLEKTFSFRWCRGTSIMGLGPALLRPGCIFGPSCLFAWHWQMGHTRTEGNNRRPIVAWHIGTQVELRACLSWRVHLPPQRFLEKKFSKNKLCPLCTAPLSTPPHALFFFLTDRILVLKLTGLSVTKSRVNSIF